MHAGRNRITILGQQTHRSGVSRGYGQARKAYVWRDDQLVGQEDKGQNAHPIYTAMWPPSRDATIHLQAPI